MWNFHQKNLAWVGLCMGWSMRGFHHGLLQTNTCRSRSAHKVQCFLRRFCIEDVAHLNSHPFSPIFDHFNPFSPGCAARSLL